MGCPEAELIAQVLRDGLMLDGRSFDPITRRPGEAWRTLRNRQLDPAEAAALVLDSEEVLGLRHRCRCRLLVIDVDHHGAKPSPYWHPEGQSPELLRLQAEAEAAGCPGPLIRSSSSGGLHVWLALPVPLPCELAHWVGRALLHRAGMEPGPGRCELFPSSTPWSPGRDCKEWHRRHGIRLPGQAGSALHTGRGWADDPQLPWLELRAALQAAEAGPAWDDLLAEAEALMTAHKRASRPRSAFPLPRRSAGTIRHRVRWTGPGQSNRNLGDLANVAYRQTQHRDPEALGAVVEALARNCPGFDQHASADTRQNLSAWCLRWARSCLSKPPTARRTASTDPGRNARLHREAVCRVIDAAARAARENGVDVLGWSERMVAEFAGVARNTLRPLLNLWRSRVTAAVFGVRGAAGSDPSPTRGGTQFLGSIPETPAVSFLRSSIFFPVATGPPGGDRQRSPHPPLELVPSADWLRFKRERERAELLAWIGAA